MTTYKPTEFQVVLKPGEMAVKVSELTLEQAQQQLCHYLAFLCDMEDAAQAHATKIDQFMRGRL